MLIKLKIKVYYDMVYLYLALNLYLVNNINKF